MNATAHPTTARVAPRALRSIDLGGASIRFIRHGGRVLFSEGDLYDVLDAWQEERLVDMLMATNGPADVVTIEIVGDEERSFLTARGLARAALAAPGCGERGAPATAVLALAMRTLGGIIPGSYAAPSLALAA